VDFTQRDAAHTFVDGLRHRELIMGGDRSLIQVLKLEVVKATAGPPARLPE
jgi:hypothetical protein